jgi:hypothetical protein
LNQDICESYVLIQCVEAVVKNNLLIIFYFFRDNADKKTPISDTKNPMQFTKEPRVLLQKENLDEIVKKSGLDKSGSKKSKSSSESLQGQRLSNQSKANKFII